jgi:hypothetical protein
MSHTAPTALFSRWHLKEFIREKQRLAEEEVRGLKTENFQSQTLEHLSADTYRRHEIPPVVLGAAGLKPPEEEDFDKTDFGMKGKRRAFLYTLAVPFTGNRDLLWCIPPAPDNHPPTFHVGEKELTYPFLNKEELTKKGVDGHFKLALALLSQWLTMPNQAAADFNRALQSQIPRWLGERQKKLEGNADFMAGLSFPLQKTEPPAPVALPLERKQIELAESASTHPAERERVLEEAHYRDILQTLALMSKVMERSPHAFAKIDEESLRFFFLFWLNANYRSGATAETFNVGGKTDILINVEGKTVFIGECKFWKGPASLLAAIDQILTYTTWRDTKTAILLFNRKSRLSTLLAKIGPTVRKHPTYLSDLDVDVESEKSFLLANPKDPSRTLVLTVLTFDVPKP